MRRPNHQTQIPIRLLNWTSTISHTRARTHTSFLYKLLEKDCSIQFAGFIDPKK